MQLEFQGFRHIYDKFCQGENVDFPSLFLIITDLGDPSVSLPMNPKSKGSQASFRGT